nr:uncharacterized protein LOC133576839 [Nerophis lumbriciformis]
MNQRYKTMFRDTREPERSYARRLTESEHSPAGHVERTGRLSSWSWTKFRKRPGSGQARGPGIYWVDDFFSTSRFSTFIKITLASVPSKPLKGTRHTPESTLPDELGCHGAVSNPQFSRSKIQHSVWQNARTCPRTRVALHAHASPQLQTVSNPRTWQQSGGQHKDQLLLGTYAGTSLTLSMPALFRMLELCASTSIQILDCLPRSSTLAWTRTLSFLACP